MANDDTRCVCIGPCLLDAPPLWTSGPFYSGMQRHHVLALQMLLMDPEIEKAGMEFADLFNQKAIELGIARAEQNPEAKDFIEKNVRGRKKNK